MRFLGMGIGHTSRDGSTSASISDNNMDCDFEEYGDDETRQGENKDIGEGEGEDSAEEEEEETEDEGEEDREERSDSEDDGYDNL